MKIGRIENRHLPMVVGIITTNMINITITKDTTATITKYVITDPTEKITEISVWHITCLTNIIVTRVLRLSIVAIVRAVVANCTMMRANII